MRTNIVARGQQHFRSREDKASETQDTERGNTDGAVVGTSGEEFPKVSRHRQPSHPFRFSMKGMGSGCNLKSQSQFWDSGSALGLQGPT